MQPFLRHTGRVAALRRAHVDTDQIIPKQFLKRVERTGFGPALFYDWRYLPGGAPNPDFELNHPKAAGASVLLAGPNFGCGSSREHAPWALAEYGFRAIVAPSYADIFYANCFQNGMLPVVLPDAALAELFARYDASAGPYEVTIDLERQRVSDAAGFDAGFEVDRYRREMLLRGLDEIGLTLLEEERIAAYEQRRKAESAGAVGSSGRGS
jgi:3-isopropylmalate/(R)-2-methylmalate dehydratase small subunit